MSVRARLEPPRGSVTVFGKRCGVWPLPDSLLTDAALVARLERGTKRRGPDECWPYGRTSRGYKSIEWLVDGETRWITVTRLALALKLGHWPKFLACHTCDFSPCVNPAHLYDGTHADNMRDALERGQARPKEYLRGSRRREALNASINS